MLVFETWYSKDTLPEEIPTTTFGLAESWKKPSFDNYDKVLIQELMFLAGLSLLKRHQKVILSLTALAKCGFLAAYSGESPNIKELYPFVPSNLSEAIHDLGIENKCNRPVRESFFLRPFVTSWR